MSLLKIQTIFCDVDASSLLIKTKHIRMKHVCLVFFY